jgi:hypothetical protein
MISRIEEETIRQIVREEIAADELRRLAEKSSQERSDPAPTPAVPGVMPSRPGTVFLGRQGK